MTLKDWKKVSEPTNIASAGQWKIGYKKGNRLMAIYKEYGVYVVEEIYNNKYKPWHKEGTYSQTLKYLKAYMRKH